MSAKEIYLVTGGPSTKPGVLEQDFRTALEATGRTGPKVAYVGTASLDSRSFFGWLKRPLLKAGASQVELAPIVGKNADVEAARRILTGADAVFMTGGEVEDGMVWLRKTGLDALLKELYEGGRLFFGISAGCIMMGRNWVHWDKEGDDDTARLFDCLGFIPRTFDAHGENEGWSELKTALKLMGDGAEGYGLADGGFYTADGESFKSLRVPPAIYRRENSRTFRV